MNCMQLILSSIFATKYDPTGCIIFTLLYYAYLAEIILSLTYVRVSVKKQILINMYGVCLHLVLMPIF